MAAFTVTVEDASVPLYLTVSSITGGVGGLSPTVAVRLAANPTMYLDFADATFKATGWMTQDAPLFEVRRGHYERTLSIPDLIAAGLAPEHTLCVEYRVNEGSTRAEGQDIIVLSRERNVTASSQLDAC